MTAPILIKRLKNKHPAQSGFTLIELMTVIAVVALVTLWGIPNYGNYVAKRRVDSAVTQITASIKLTRSQAMTTGRVVNLCGLNAARTGCSATPADWSSAWGIVVSSAGNSTVIQVYEAPKLLTIAADDIVVGANGMRTGGGSIVISVTPEGGSTGKTVTINNASLSYEIGTI